MEYEKASEQRRGEETKYGGPEEINDNDGQNLHIYIYMIIYMYIYMLTRDKPRKCGGRGVIQPYTAKAWQTLVK